MRFSGYILCVENLIARFCLVFCRRLNCKVLVMSVVHFCDILKNLTPRAEYVQDFS